MDMKTATRLYTLRRRNGLSQEELAEALGVTRQAVSKWERGESSPDTENLIALARLYRMSLDQLIGVEEIPEDAPPYSASKQEESKQESYRKEEPRAEEPAREEFCYTYREEPKSEEQKQTARERFNIHVESKEGDFVKVGLGGIDIRSKDGSTVQIGGGKGIHIADGKGEAFHVENGHIRYTDGKKKDWENAWQGRKKPMLVYLLESPVFAVLTVAAYLCLGFMLDLWHPGWIVFLTVPIYYGLTTALFYKKPQSFPMAILCAAAYLVAGLYFNHWHPSWAVFFLIPLYHGIVEGIIKARKLN